jgi:hypothetical protein
MLFGMYLIIELLAYMLVPCSEELPQTFSKGASPIHISIRIFELFHNLTKAYFAHLLEYNYFRGN